MNQASQPTASKWLRNALIVIIVVVAGYFGWYYISGPGKADWYTYNNTQYGFQLSFTDKWKGYTTKPTGLITQNNINSGILAQYYINVPAANYYPAANGEMEVLAITIYTPDAYINAQIPTGGPGPGTLMGKTDKYVVTYDAASGLTGDPATEFYNTLIPNLAKTFKAI